MSNYINESHLYFETKEFLKKLGWTPIAGEPSGGSDELPRIEIRDPNNINKGSKGSYKIDLISTKENNLLLTEIKTRFAYSDITKLNEICDLRLVDLKTALLERLNVDISKMKIIKSLSMKYRENNDIPDDFVCFELSGLEQNIINSALLPKN